MERKIVSILGDSISTFGGLSMGGEIVTDKYADGTLTYKGNRVRYPQENLLMDVNECYWMRAINHFGFKLGMNESFAGARTSWDMLSETKDQGKKIYSASDERINHLGINGNPNYIIIYTGTNDLVHNVDVGEFENNTDIKTFTGAYRVMLNKLKLKYPFAKLVAITPCYAEKYYSADSLLAVCDIIIKLCEEENINYVDSRKIGITKENSEDYLGDGIHFNAKGMELLANALIEKFPV